MVRQKNSSIPILYLDKFFQCHIFFLSLLVYSMSPRSWKPDKSLSDAVPSETIQPIETPRLAEPEDPLALLEAKNSTEVHGLGSAKGRNMLSEYSAQYEEENETKKVVDGNISPASTTRYVLILHR